MFGYGKVLSAAVGVAALSGTLLLPSANSFAAPAVIAASVETIPEATPLPVPAILPPAIVEAAPEPAPAPVEQADETAKASVDARELECMTKVMLYEAGAEGRAGQLAVAHVVLNRVRSPKFPDSVCSVIYQRGQFSSIRSFSPPRNARWNGAMALARDVMGGETQSNVGKALYFHATRVSPAYVRSRTRVAQVGNHIFYR